MGAVAALLAGACVAPVVIQVVLFSSNLYATGTKLALALPFFLGIGMAIPWPIAGAGLAALPKPGVWMVRVKQAFGVVHPRDGRVLRLRGLSIFREPLGRSGRRRVERRSEKLKAGWHASLAEGLATAKRENKPVLIDMWATWCKNCLTMDKTTLENGDVQTALDRLREDQVPGGRSRRATREGCHAEAVRARASRLRDPQSQAIEPVGRFGCDRQGSAAGSTLRSAIRPRIQSLTAPGHGGSGSQAISVQQDSGQRDERAGQQCKPDTERHVREPQGNSQDDQQRKESDSQLRVAQAAWVPETLGHSAVGFALRQTLSTF